MDTQSTQATNTQPTAPSAQTQGSNQAQAGNQTQGQGAATQGGAGDTARSVTQALDSKPKAPQAADAVREYKINGKVVRMTQKEADDYVSMSYAANSKFDEAAKLRKSVDKIISTAKTNPIEALMDPALGLTKDQIRDAFESWYHKEYIEAEQLTPDQKKVREYETKLKAYEEAEAQKQREAQEREQAELTNKQREYLQGQIIDALERSGLPKTPLIASRMAFYMRENMLKGWDAPIDLIVKQVKEERQGLMQGEVGGLEGNALIQYLGEEIVNKIRKFDLQRLREQRSSKTPEFKSSQNNTDGYGNREKLSSKDVNQRLRELRMGKSTF